MGGSGAALAVIVLACGRATVRVIQVHTPFAAVSFPFIPFVNPSIVARRVLATTVQAWQLADEQCRTPRRPRGPQGPGCRRNVLQLS